MTPLDQLRAFARYRTHAGYRWAAVASDGGLFCEPCVRAEYRQVYRATRDDDRRSGWAVIGLTNSGDRDYGQPPEYCAHCNQEIFAATEECTP